MSIQLNALRELVVLFNEGRPIDLARFFTEDFRLDDPGAGVKRTGHDGARQMLEAVRALAPDVRLKIVDMFEAGDRVAVPLGSIWGRQPGCNDCDLPVRRKPHCERLGHLGALALDGTGGELDG